MRSRDFHVYICDDGLREHGVSEYHDAELVDENWLNTAIECALIEYGLKVVSVQVRELKPGDAVSVEPPATVDGGGPDA